ncbi:MAG TPA: ATP synthase F1 subunit delta [Gemmatimonadaceae bacterium]|nr:ATP synthase F1 subunit delta [Gemmatimonadaceae bacterium]
MREPTIARNYAETLVALARKANDLEGWGAMIHDVADAIQRDARLRQFLQSPRISADRKNEILGRAFQDRLPRLFVRFIQAVIAHRRQALLGEIALEYSALVDELSNRVHAEVTLAREPDPALRAAVATGVSRALGKTVVPHFTVRPEILGGLIVRVGDTVIDGSVRRRLLALRNRLMAGPAAAAI